MTLPSSTMKTITVSITRIPPRYLFALRYLCRIIGATMVVCRGKRQGRKLDPDPLRGATE